MTKSKIIYYLDTIKNSKYSKTGNWKDMLINWLKKIGVTSRIIWDKDILGVRGAALTYYTFMSFVPLMAMIFALAKGFGYYEYVTDWIRSFFDSQPKVAEVIVQFVDNYLANAHDGYILGLGLVTMLVILIMLVQSVEDVFNLIWNVKSRSIIRMITDYVTLLTFFAILVLVASGLNVYSVAFSDELEIWTSLDWLGEVWCKLISVVLMSAFFMYFYYFLPNTYVRFRNVVIPSILAGVSMCLLQYLYLYIQVWLASYNIIYGSFAAIPLFLLWLRVSWSICLFGAVLCYANQNIHYYDSGVNDSTRLKLTVQRKICVLLLHHIGCEFKKGNPPLSAVDLQRLTKVPQSVINQHLSLLVDGKLIYGIKTSEVIPVDAATKYIPCEDISNITYGEMIERLGDLGDDFKLDAENLGDIDLRAIDHCYQDYIKSTRQIRITDL